MTAPITSFRGPYRFLSNFAPVNVRLHVGGYLEFYPSVEHAYQAAKCLDLDERRKIRLAPSPGAAKKLGKLVLLRPDWETVKIGIMLDLLTQKFSQEPFRTKLIATGDAQLVESNTWGDIYWGVCNGKGENVLGRLLMRVRSEVGKPF